MRKFRPKLILFSSLAVVSVLVLLGASPDNSTTGQMTALDKRVAALESEIASLKLQVTRAHPDRQTEQAAQVAFASINALITSGQAMEAKTKLNSFMDEYGNTKAGQQAQAMARNLAAVGKTVPTSWDVEKWYQGDDSAFNGSRATILVFWETWCPHCRRAMPTLQKTYDQYKGRGLNIIGFTKLSRGSTEQAVQDFIIENKLQYPMAKETGNLSTYFGVGGIPSAAVILNGKTVWSGHPAGISNAMIEGWLGDQAS